MTDEELEKEFVKRNDVWQLWKDMGMDTESFVDFATKLYKFNKSAQNKAISDFIEEVKKEVIGEDAPVLERTELIKRGLYNSAHESQARDILRHTQRQKLKQLAQKYQEGER